MNAPDVALADLPLVTASSAGPEVDVRLFAAPDVASVRDLLRAVGAVGV